MNAPSIDIRTLLEQESILTIPVHIGSEPAEPNNVITIYDTAGFRPMLTLDRNETFEFPSVQIRVRNVSYLSCLEVCATIKQILHGRGQEIVDGAFYALIRCNHEPEPLGFDTKQRMRFVMNFEIQRKESI